MERSGMESPCRVCLLRSQCYTIQYKKRVTAVYSTCSHSSGRDDPTRTDDPYVPNVVRYQLRYIPMPVWPDLV